MRTIQTTLYTFDELGEEAKEKARDQFRGENTYFETDQDEIFESTKQGIEEIGCSLDDWSFGIHNQSWKCRTSGGLSGLELYNKIRQFKNGDYFFDGMCFDRDFCDEAVKAYEKDGLRDANEIAYQVFQHMQNVLEEAYEYMQTDEYVYELIEANGYEFTEEGELI
jgi:hypothetical protein